MHVYESCKPYWILSFVFQLKELLDTYYPIEIDCTRPVDEKLPLMVEW